MDPDSGRELRAEARQNVDGLIGHRCFVRGACCRLGWDQTFRGKRWTKFSRKRTDFEVLIYARARATSATGKTPPFPFRFASFPLQLGARLPHSSASTCSKERRGRPAIGLEYYEIRQTSLSFLSLWTPTSKPVLNSLLAPRANLRCYPATLLFLPWEGLFYFMATLCFGGYHFSKTRALCTFTQICTKEGQDESGAGTENSFGDPNR